MITSTISGVGCLISIKILYQVHRPTSSSEWSWAKINIRPTKIMSPAATIQIASAVPIGRVVNAGQVVTRSIWSATRSKTSVKNAFEHWKSHGAEFPELFNSKQYVEAARRFLHNSPEGTLIIVSRCCGVEFGNQDYTIVSAKRYRINWINNGAVWYDKSCKPEGWNLEEQMQNIPLLYK